MNFSQRLGLFILIAISVAYVYFSFFNNGQMPKYSEEQTPVFNPLETTENTPKIEQEETKTEKTVKIFLLDKSGELRAVNRICESSENSCFEFSITELISGPNKWEKSKGFTSEIPQNTRILSIRESANSVLVDLSSDFEAGGGAESTYMRVKQIIKTVNANSKAPAYLYINGKQANVIGGEGIMIKQPLNDKSIEE